MQIGEIAEFMAGMILIAAIIIGSCWWINYKYHDCIKVGHTKTYCLVDIFSG